MTCMPTSSSINAKSNSNDQRHVLPKGTLT